MDDMETFEVLYHNTKPAQKSAIAASEKLYYGTFFCCSLYMGKLPTTSPRNHGPERIKMRVDDVMRCFTDPCLYRWGTYEVGRTDGGTNKYYEFLLVDGELERTRPTDPNNHFYTATVKIRNEDETRDDCTKVDPLTNTYLRIGNVNRPHKVKQHAGMHWVNLIVMKEIILEPGNHSWEIVGTV